MRYVELLKITLLCVILAEIQGQSSEDIRCKCICPNVSSEIITSPDREVGYAAKILYLVNVPQNQCNCDGVILPRLGANMKRKGREFCLECNCKHESRYTGTIKLIAVIAIWISSLLVLYMAFMIIFNPLFIKRVEENDPKSEDTSDATTSASDDIVSVMRRNPLLHIIPILKYE